MFGRVMKRWALVVAAIGLAACAEAEPTGLRGTVAIDGSSTVYPITEAVAEEFGVEYPQVRPTVGISGTGGGFKSFTAGQADISNASRPIRPEELERARQNDVDFVEIPVAYDGLTIVTNPANDWVDTLSVDQIKQIFLSDSTIQTWSDVNPDWPNEKIKIYSPGTDSGTFDYFKEVVAGEEGSIRPDMSVSEDDNVLVRGVAGDKNALGFFGYAYYVENQDQLNAVKIVNPETGQAVMPTPQTIESGDYAPFSRPLFIYVNTKSAERPEVDAFVRFYLEEGPELAGEVGYIRLPGGLYDKARQKHENRQTGTVFVDNGQKVSGSLTELY